jgi:hypothetical protein
MLRLILRTIQKKNILPGTKYTKRKARNAIKPVRVSAWGDPATCWESQLTPFQNAQKLIIARRRMQAHQAMMWGTGISS